MSEATVIQWNNDDVKQFLVYRGNRRYFGIFNNLGHSINLKIYVVSVLYLASM